jgi:hypothetical protein
VQTRFELILNEAYSEDKRAVACLRRTEATVSQFQQVTIVGDKAHLTSGDHRRRSRTTASESFGISRSLDAWLLRIS